MSVPVRPPQNSPATSGRPLSRLSVTPAAGRPGTVTTAMPVTMMSPPRIPGQPGRSPSIASAMIIVSTGPVPRATG